MTRDQIIALAREAGQADFLSGTGHWFKLEVSDLERFASLVAAAEVESLRADAARYRWLRDNPWPNPEFASVIQMHQNALWDEAIDAAMRGDA